MNNNYETWVMMNAENDVISEEHETANEVLAEVSENYTIEEMKENGFTICRIISDSVSWLECLEELQPDEIEIQ